MFFNILSDVYFSIKCIFKTLLILILNAGVNHMHMICHNDDIKQAKAHNTERETEWQRTAGCGIKF